MRRGVGVGGLRMQAAATAQFKERASGMAEQENARMREQLERFRASLEDFARAHRKDVARDPQFRQRFNEMCTRVGVDPLASRRGFWAELLGVGDFYYELGVQVVDACLRSRPANGGLMDLDSLRTALIRMRGPKAAEICVDDVERAIAKLRVLGSGFGIIRAGGRKLVQSVPCELNIDHTNVLSLAAQQGHAPQVTASEVMRQLSWDSARVNSVLGLLLKEGMVWVDDQGPERSYWFPSLAAVSFD
eukprot:m51a1_g14460 putative vacuolar-sorting protein snf8 (247) ;mRNA; r:657678-659031